MTHWRTASIDLITRMIISEIDFHIEGHQLRRTIFDPPNGIKTRAACLFTHGQGDNSGRYKDVLHPFTEAGIRCISVDLLGHGMSSGRRGNCGNIKFVDQIIQNNLDLIGALPYGIAGHSMGGLLTLRHLSLALEGKLPKPAFCWVNSPLLNPAQNRSALFVKLALTLAKIAPNVSIKTGASAELCRTPDDSIIGDSKALSLMNSIHGHQKISIGWGAELINISRYIYSVLPEHNSDIPFLFSQGDSDLICPHSIAEGFYAQLNFSNKRLEIFTNMRHETFAEPNKEELFKALREWISQLDL